MTKWTKYWTRDYTYHYIENCLSMYRYGLKKAGIKPFKEIVFVRKNGLFSVHSTVAERTRFQNEGLKKYAKNAERLKIFKTRFMDAGKRYYALGKKIYGKNLQKCTGKQLLAMLKDYYGAWVDFTTYVWCIWIMHTNYTRDVINYITEKAAKLDMQANVPEYNQFISTPARKSSILLLNDEIAKCKKEHRKIDYKKIYRRYIWMPWGDLHAEDWNISHVKKFVEEHKAPATGAITLAEMAKQLQLDKKEREMVLMAKDMVFLSDYRDEVRRKTVYPAHFLYAEIARRFNVSYKDLMFYSTPEAYGLFRGKKLSAAEIKARKGDTVSFFKGSKFIVLSGKEGDKMMAEILAGESDAGQGIQGLIASPGKARGVVKIVRLDNEISKVCKGDIMVAVTTHPEYVPKMAIAAAIVTDEGGLTCHAAVVSREMKKPCIVGTGNATKLLKDGDVIEVDAVKGVVRKVK